MLANRKTLILIAMMALWLASTAGCAGEAAPPPGSNLPAAAQAAATPTPVAVARVPVSAGPRGSLSIVEAAARVRPAVVNITSRTISYDMFLRAVPDESGVGSGILFDARGLIITNNHVIAGARSLSVILPDGRSFEGTLVGADPRTDLAVVKVQGADLPIAELGDSDLLQIGESVVAIGNALALPGGPTVTAGIVGAIGRTIDEDNGNTLYDLIQTDAAINPGNSGGPLIDLTGRVVGINTALAVTPGGGIGFAIAINGVKPIVNELVSQGRVRRAGLGVELASVTSTMAVQYSLSVKQGAYLVRVTRNGPAARAGLQRGDIVVSMDDDKIDDAASLLKAIAKRGIGAKVKITYYRGDQRRTAEATLEELSN